MYRIMYYFGYFIHKFSKEHCAAPIFQTQRWRRCAYFKNCSLLIPYTIRCGCMCYVVCAVGLMAVDECRNCTGGLYCADYNMTSPGDSCQPGMYSVSVDRYILSPFI